MMVPPPPRWTQEARGEALPPMYTTRQRCQHRWNPIKVLYIFPGFYFLQRYVCNFINKWSHGYFKIDISDPTMSVALCCFWEWDILYSSKKTSKIHATSPSLTQGLHFAFLLVRIPDHILAYNVIPWFLLTQAICWIVTGDMVLNLIQLFVSKCAQNGILYIVGSEMQLGTQWRSFS